MASLVGWFRRGKTIDDLDSELTSGLGELARRVKKLEDAPAPPSASQLMATATDDMQLSYHVGNALNDLFEDIGALRTTIKNLSTNVARHFPAASELQASVRCESSSRAAEDRDLRGRIDALSETLAEMTGNPPGMWTRMATVDRIVSAAEKQLAAIRNDIDQLIDATGCERYALRELPARAARPQRQIIRKKVKE